MKKLLAVIFVCIFLSFAFLVLGSKSAQAYFDPVARPNNFHGIHILFASELQDASTLVNSSNGEWGYVTIPIQAGDKDLEKWQAFMDDCRKFKLIPIVRLLTEPDPQNTAVWREPTATDILDFANFLDSLDWPIENRYIIVFNEMNRFDEWGGKAPDPVTYAGLLRYASQTFKERSSNFYIIMGGLDNASPNDRIKYMDNFAYLKDMVSHDPDIFRTIDGFSSHSYPNPGFVAPPLSNKMEGVTTYQFEYAFINAHTDRKVPAFITETGWDSSKLPESLVAKYYKTTYENFWNKDKDKIVAITPFLLHSQGGAFDIFSFVKDGRQTEYYAQTKNMVKQKGEPILQAVRGIASQKVSEFQKLVRQESEEPGDLLTKKIFINYLKLFF